MTKLIYHRTAERPDLQFWLQDDAGALIDFSSGFTFEFKLGSPGKAAAFTKTTGITGAVGAGIEKTGEPNVTITFVADELDDVPVRDYTWQIRATSGGLDRFFSGEFRLIDVIT